MLADPRSHRRTHAALAAALIAVLAIAIFATGGANCITLPGADAKATSDNPVVAALLAPAPRLPVGLYDHFGELKTPAEARDLVIDAGLDPNQPSHFARIGLVHITQDLIDEGRELFFRGFLGDPFTLTSILNLGNAFGKTPVEVGLDSFDPQADPDGAAAFLRDLILGAFLRPKSATTNYRVRLTRDLHVGTQVFPAGTWIDTGADIAAGSFVPVGFEGGSVSCALCHSAVDPLTGQEIPGKPNTDLNISLFIALSPNSAAAFLKLTLDEFNPLDPKWPKTGRRIITGTGDTATLPDPIAFERAIDDFIMTVPPGGFDAAPDATTATTQIPDAFTFGEGSMGWDGGFQIGPFGGLSAFSSAVHSFEVNFLSPPSFIEEVHGLDIEVYLGTILQNAPDPDLRIPDDVRPSEWLRERFPFAERGRLIELPHFPEPSLFSINGLAFSPPDEPYLHAANALSAFQQSLVVPPNKSMANLMNIRSGAVTRGAEVFLAAGCADCHPAPFYTTGRIVSNQIIGANGARARARLALTGRLVPPEMLSFDQPVPLPPNPNMITLPAPPGSPDNVSLPPGLDNPEGGFKVTGLLGTYLRGPYLHDGGVAVGPDALRILEDGSYEILDAMRIGVPGTIKQARDIDAAHSLRALLDRDLRAILVANNMADPDLVNAHLDGSGHAFFVDPGAGFTFQQQTDLIAFLLALDDDPGDF